MPFNKISEFEKSFPGVKSLTPEQKKIALEIFNNAMEKGDDEGTAIIKAIGSAKKMSDVFAIFSDFELSDFITDHDLESQEYEILKVGEYYDGRYGKFKITKERLENIKKNFDENILEIDIAVDVNHDDNGAAFAWIRELSIRGDSLFARFKDITEEGKKILKEKIYKYFSVEFAPFVKVINGKKETFMDVLRGLALTNRPVIKGMRPAFSEARVLYSENVYLLFNSSNMDVFKIYLSELKEKEKVSQEELVCLKAMFSALSSDQKEELKSDVDSLEAKLEEEPVVEPAVEEAPKEEEKAEEVPAEEVVPAVEEPKEENKEEEAKEPEAAEASEVALKLAEQGKQIEELKAREKARVTSDRVKELMLSEVGKPGFSAVDDTKEALTSFVLTLSDEQYKQFNSIVNRVVLLSEDKVVELGHGKPGIKLSEELELDKKVSEYAEKHNISYAEAFKKLIK